jgi:hypothetical protein
MDKFEAGSSSTLGGVTVAAEIKKPARGGFLIFISGTTTLPPGSENTD